IKRKKMDSIFSRFCDTVLQRAILGTSKSDVQYEIIANTFTTAKSNKCMSRAAAIPSRLMGNQRQTLRGKDRKNGEKQFHSCHCA
ncbi:hypothetical protein PENTCL1PPCAC_951, partial [Pristionchus entomophagus]